MLDDANDPTVALAFLNVLREDDEPTAQLQYLIAKQRVQLNEFEEAIALIEPAERFEQTPYQEEIYDLFTRSLWQLATLRQDETAAAATDRLHEFLSQNISDFSDDELNRFAQYAIQTGAPALSYRLRAQSSTTSESELFALAQQSGLANESYQHALQIYRDDPTFENVQRVLTLVQQLGNWDQGIALAEQHASLDCDNACLQVLINFLLAGNAVNSAADLAFIKAQRSDSPDDWLQATQQALATGELVTAAFWLERVVDESAALRSAHQRQLIDLYVGLQRFDDALALMQEFITPDDSPELIRYVIRVAYAAINIEVLESYLYGLAAQGVATLVEIREWIAVADRLNGADYVSDALYSILEGETASGQLTEAELRLIEVELGRFYNFVGDQEGTIALWRSRHPGNIPNIEEPYSYENLNQFIQAFVDLNEPEEALETAVNFLDLTELNLDQLDNIRSLAYFVGERDTLRDVQEILLAREANTIDPFLLIATHEVSDASERQRLWEYYRLFSQNQAGSVNQLPDSARIILDSILQGAILDQNSADVARIKEQLANYHDHQSVEMQELRLRIATYEEDNETARQLLQQLIALRPAVQRYKEDSVWIAIALDDSRWLEELYRQLFASALNNADLIQLMAYAAQNLDNTLHAQFWYQQLYEQGLAAPSDILAYAILLQEHGNDALAQALRWQVISTMADELRAELNGEISYRSLLSIFVGPAHSNSQLTQALAEGVEAEEINSILFTQSQNGLQRIAYWQAIGMLEEEQLSETVQLALALARRDENAIRNLAIQGQNLTGLERASSLAQIDERRLAWQYGEEALNPSLTNNELAPMQRLLANEHWHRSHGWSYAFAGTPSYGLGGSELEYYRPVRNGQMHVTLADAQADQPSFYSEDYSSQSLNIGWQTPEEHYQLGVQHRYGESHANLQIDTQWQVGPWLTPSASLFWNTPATQSENLALAGRQSGIQLGTAWQLTSRTSISANIQAREFETDFSERIGDSRQISLRVSDIWQRVPVWQIYMQYDLQENDIADGELTRLMSRTNTSTTVTPGAFLSDKYHRFAIGQSVTHDNIGRQGPDVKGARYLFDTSLGYNFELEEVDFNISFGLGVRVFGGDELSVTGSWQNADINGQTSTQINVKYFMDF
ncbi:MAG TPA: hypothetical protein DEG76_01695 [Pseudohongiella sp.]|nr:hypothetical protein [Pseudohongiella sp.]